MYVCMYNVRTEEMLQRVKGERNAVQTVKRRKANWIGHILRRNCLLRHVIGGKIEGRIEVKGRLEEDVSSYWMTLSKREDTVDLKRKN